MRVVTLPLLLSLMTTLRTATVVTFGVAPTCKRPGTPKPIALAVHAKIVLPSWTTRPRIMLERLVGSCAAGGGNCGELTKPSTVAAPGLAASANWNEVVVGVAVMVAVRFHPDGV